MPVLTFSLALSIRVLEKSPESMPLDFHIYTPSATPNPKMPGLQWIIIPIYMCLNDPEVYERLKQEALFIVQEKQQQSWSFCNVGR